MNINVRIPTRVKQQLKEGQSEHGTTLVETLVALSIIVLVFGILTTALVQFFLVTRWGNDQLRITNDLQVASLWLGRDALESASFTPGTGAVYGTLNWADSTHQYRYSYNSSNNELVREHFEDSILLSTLQVSRYIANRSDVVFSTSGQLLTVSITSSSGNETETVSLNLALRSQ
jgi:Tfp pilus assembly protein PilW